MTGTLEGSREVLYTCSYVPEEIILAAGFRPRRFLPESRPSDARVHPNTCGYVKNLLAAALDGRAAEAAGIVIANSCDAMRRLYDLWTAYASSVPAVFLDIPKKADDDSITMFAADLKTLAITLPAAFPGERVDDVRLREAIRTCNEIRVLMTDVFAAQRHARSDGVGSRVFDLCLAGASRERMGFAASIRQFFAEVAGERHSAAKAPRIVLAGGLVNTRDIAAAIERAGAHVVALDTCLGLRHYEGCVEEDAADPFHALAKRYLTKPGCARMQGTEARLRWLKQVAEDSEADGIVFCSPKFCGPCAYDVPVTAERCRTLGIPFLPVEHDYEGSGREQLHTRIEAFVELRH